MINSAYKQNFETLRRAIKDDCAALVETQDKVTGKTVIVLAAVQREPGGGFTIIPLAKLFDGDPYEELLPPAPGGGFREPKSN